MENKIKDQPLRSNVETKTSQVKTLLQLQSKVKDKGKEVNDIVQKQSLIEGNTDLALHVGPYPHRRWRCLVWWGVQSSVLH